MKLSLRRPQNQRWRLFCLCYGHLKARTFLYSLPHWPKLHRIGSPMIVALCALAVSRANTAGAQKREPNETEKAWAAQIKCEDFAENSDGGWTSGANVRIGGTELGGNTFGVRGVNVNGAADAAPTGPLKPAVLIKRSITPEYLVCLEDGKKFKSLKRHLRSQYQMTPDQYRAKWNLPATYPMVAPKYAAARSQLAKQMGLGQQRRHRRESS
jgi:hypothetical protein